MRRLSRPRAGELEGQGRHGAGLCTRNPGLLPRRPCRRPVRRQARFPSPRSRRKADRHARQLLRNAGRLFVQDLLRRALCALFAGRADPARESEILDRGEVEWMDSCAVPDHPMIDSLWSGRREIVRVTVRLREFEAPLVFAFCRALETGLVALRALFGRGKSMTRIAFDAAARAAFAAALSRAAGPARPRPGRPSAAQARGARRACPPDSSGRRRI